MERDPLILLDTHAAVFLHGGRTDLFTETARYFLEVSPLAVSPMTVFEMDYLFEIKRIAFHSKIIISDLENDLGLTVLDRNWYAVIKKAGELTWTRDPFDRCLAAHAEAEGLRLLTRDQELLTHCSLAFW
jgi:PIN domain nuclease of toxin-antitoxin system